MWRQRSITKSVLVAALGPEIDRFFNEFFCLLLIKIKDVWLQNSRITTFLSLLHGKYSENPWNSPENPGFLIYIDNSVPQRHFKGTVSEISSDSPCKDSTARFTTIPFRLCLTKYELDMKVYNFKNWLF